MPKNLARVYFRSFLPGESHPEVIAKEPDMEDSWRERACMEFVHDMHSKCETFHVAEQSEQAILAALQARHPSKFILVDKVSWLEDDVR